MKSKADIGLIGLAVMGENLVLNMESNGFTVAVYNRTVEKVESLSLEGEQVKISLEQIPLKSLLLHWSVQGKSCCW